jgi:hypothetical protein
VKEDAMAEKDERDEGKERDESWVALEGVPNETEGALLAGFLESEGIPARVVDRSFHMTPMPEDEDLSPIVVAVPKDRRAEAEELLASREAEGTGPEADDGDGPGGGGSVG